MSSVRLGGVYPLPSIDPEKGAAMLSKQMPDGSAGEDSFETISHDQIWKTLIPQFLEDFFQLIQPEIAAELDLSTVEWLDKEAFLDFPKGARAEVDLLGRARNRDNEERFFLLHHEFEGDFRSNMDSRVDRYIMYLRLTHKEPVVSFVLFLKGGPKGLKIRSVVDRIGSIEIYRSSYFAFGFGDQLAEEWLERPEPLAAAFAALMRSQIWDAAEKKLQCLQAIARTSLDEARRLALVDVVETYVELTPEEAERYSAELARESNQEICEMGMSWSQKLRAEGRLEGRVEGEALGLRSAILMLWENKFGPLASAVRQQLEKMTDRSRLYDVLKQVSEARSAEEIRL